MQKARQGPEATSGVRGGAVGGWKGCKKGPQVSTGSKPRNPKSNFWYFDCLDEGTWSKRKQGAQRCIGGLEGLQTRSKSNVYEFKDQGNPTRGFLNEQRGS